jgi:hypothetical protein
MMPDPLWRLVSQSANEIVVLGLGLLVVYKLAHYAVGRYFDLLERQTPVFERGILAVEKLAKVGEDISSEFIQDHKILFASMRGLRWEIDQVRAEHGPTETA